MGRCDGGTQGRRRCAIIVASLFLSGMLATTTFVGSGSSSWQVDDHADDASPSSLEGGRRDAAVNDDDVVLAPSEAVPSAVPTFIEEVVTDAPSRAPRKKSPHVKRTATPEANGSSAPSSTPTVSPSIHPVAGSSNAPSVTPSVSPSPLIHRHTTDRPTDAPHHYKKTFRPTPYPQQQNAATTIAPTKGDTYFSPTDDDDIRYNNNYDQPTIAPHNDDTAAEQQQQSETTTVKGEIAQEEQDLEKVVHDPTSKVLLTVFAVVGIMGMLLTAYMVMEHPDGLCAGCCRLSIKIVIFFYKLICLPCRFMCGRHRGYNPSHTNESVLRGAEFHTDLELS